MRLVYIDPHVSGLQTLGVDSRDKIVKLLHRKGMNAEECAGEVIYYVYIDRDGNEHKGSLDFT